MISLNNMKMEDIFVIGLIVYFVFFRKNTENFSRHRRRSGYKLNPRNCPFKAHVHNGDLHVKGRLFVDRESHLGNGAFLYGRHDYGSAKYRAHSGRCPDYDEQATFIGGAADKDTTVVGHAVGNDKKNDVGTSSI